MKKIILFILIFIVIVISCLGLYFLNKNNNKVITKTEKKINILLNKQTYKDKVEEINNCLYKRFIPSFDNGYDFTNDMTYNDKIYHKIITEYDEYIIYKDRWNSILDMDKQDFENYFMVITAIENVSMKNLTISNIYNENKILYIDMDESENDNSEETCISIIIPKEMKNENIEIRDMRKVREEAKTPESIYGWKNESTEGLTEITENEAVEIAKEYAKSLVNSNSLCGKYLEGYTKLYEVVLTQKAPNNYWLIEDGILERQLINANYERKVYEVTLVRDDDDVEMERAYFYVDVFTGEVIGGLERGD